MQGLLIQSLFIISSEFEYLSTTILQNLEDPLSVGFSHSEFSQSLDVLNYADKLISTKPKKASIDSFFLSYKLGKLRVGLETHQSSGTVERKTQPKLLKTDVKGNAVYISYNFYLSDKNSYEFGFLSKKENQDPVVIDCYAFGATVIGGSCNEAKLRLLDSDVYKSTGDLVYEPVLKTSGDAKTSGIYLRLSPKSPSLLNFNHQLSYKISTVNQSYDSSILSTTDSFIRGLTIDGMNAGVLLDQFKDELPQDSPWKENTLKYSINNLMPITDNIGLSAMYSFIKVKRKNYLNNPVKDDFTKNHLLDISVFYQLNDYGLVYLKLSASSNYLLGENPLAYNRRSNHLFDHPYGQLNAGLIINF